MDTREELRPYKKQRLGFEGVLINITEPNRRNGFTYGLIFASIYAPNEKIELDHAVIMIDKAQYAKINVQLFKRYKFTAQVALYHKTVNVLGVSALQENFMLQRININKIEEIQESALSQPTRFVMTRINNMMMSKAGNLQHTTEQLLEIVENTANDGSVERFITECTQAYQRKKINRSDMIDVLY